MVMIFGSGGKIAGTMPTIIVLFMMLRCLSINLKLIVVNEQFFQMKGVRVQ